MVAKLTRPGGPAAGQTQTQERPQATQEQPAVQPKSWAGRGAAATDAQPDQRERIQEQINPERAETGGRSAFGRRTQEAAEALQNQPVDGSEDQKQDTSNGVRTDQDPTPRTRRTRTAPIVAEPVAAAPAVEMPDNSGAILVLARAKVLAVAFADPACELADGLEIADELWKWASDVESF